MSDARAQQLPLEHQIAALLRLRGWTEEHRPGYHPSICWIDPRPARRTSERPVGLEAAVKRELMRERREGEG